MLFHMELNVEKIRNELKRLGKGPTWLATKCVVHRRTVHYWFENKTIKAAERIAEVFNMDPKDLLK